MGPGFGCKAFVWNTDERAETMRRRALAFALAAGLGLLLGGMGQARAQSQQEPVFRGIQPKQTIIDAWQREEKTHVPGQGTASPSKPARKSAGAGVPLSFLIVFEYNSSELTDTARQQLDGVAEAIKSRELSGSRFKLEGHTPTSSAARPTISIFRSGAPKRAR